MGNPIGIIGAIVVVIAVIWVIWAVRQGPPDDGIGPPPPDGTYWG